MGAFRVERPHFVILWGAVWSYALRWLLLPAPMGWVVRLFCVVCVFFFSPFMLLFCFYALLACLSWGSNVRVVCLNSRARGWNKETS